MEDCTFKAGGGNFSIEITLGLADAVRRRSGVDLCDPSRVGEVYGLLYDASKLGDVLEILCEGLDRDALTIDELGEGHAALLGAYVNFTLPAIRAGVKEAIERQVESQLQAIEVMNRTLKSPELTRQIEKQLGELEAELLNTLGDSGP